MMLRVLSRLFAAAAGLALLALIGVQFARIIEENIAMSRSLSAVQAEVQSLRERRREQERQLRRLSDPQGAVPEIHDRLHLVRPNEAIIYVKRGSPKP